MPSFDDQPSGNMPDPYDRALEHVASAQAVFTSSRPTQLRSIPMFGIGGAVSYGLQTFRQPGDILEEDTETGVIKRGPAKFIAFLEVARGERLQRIVLPDEVLALILRQRDTLTAQALRLSAKAAAATRKARGHVFKPNLEAMRAGRRKAKAKRAKKS